MISVSNEWKRTLGCFQYPSRKRIVPEAFIKIEYEQIDAEAQNNASVSVNGKQSWSTESDVMNLSLKYDNRVATLERNAWLLNGQFSARDSSDTTSHVGWVHNLLSNSVHSFSTAPKMTITWDDVQTIKIPCIQIQWSSLLDEWATSYTVNVYNGSTLLWTQTFTNTGVICQANHELENYDKVEIVINTWCLPNRFARIETITMGATVVLEKSEIVGCDFSSESDLLSFALPESSLNFEIDNVNEEWNPDRPQGKYAYLVERQRVVLSVAYKVKPMAIYPSSDLYPSYDLYPAGAEDTDYEWHKVGTFYTSEWSTPQNGITASFTAVDILQFATRPFYPELIDGYTFGDSISLYDLAEQAFIQADLPIDPDGSVKWEIDNLLRGISVVIPYTTSSGTNKYDFGYSCAEVIQLCANASVCCISFDENGTVHIKPTDDVLTDYLIDRFVAYQNGEYETQRLLQSVIINDTWEYTVSGVTDGLPQKVDNDLIQDTSRATPVANWIESILGKRRIGNVYTNAATLSGDYRADIRLQPLDLITNRNKYATNIVRVTGVKYNFTGAWHGNYEARVIRSIPVTDSDYYYYTGDFYSGGET